jgi:hypothetical protein
MDWVFDTAEYVELADEVLQLRDEVAQLRSDGVELVAGMAMLLGQLPAERRRKLPERAPDLCLLIDRFGVEQWPWARPLAKGRPHKHERVKKRRLQQLKQQLKKGAQ